MSRSQSLGGQAYWSLSAGCSWSNSSEQRRLRVRDSDELALADWLGSAAFDRGEDYWPRRWAEAYVHFAAGEQRSWLHGLGVRWFPLVQWAERGGYAAAWPRQLGAPLPRHLGHRAGVIGAVRRAVCTPGECGSAAGTRSPGWRSDETAYGCTGQMLEPSEVPRGVARPRRTAVGEFSFSAQAVVVATGGIGGNFDLVRRSWPRATGEAPQTMIAGVPDYVDGSMLEVTEAGRWTGDQPRPDVALSRGNPQPLPGVEPPRHPDPAGPSSLWLDARGRRFPAATVPRLRRAGCAATCRRQRLRLLVVRARLKTSGQQSSRCLDRSRTAT